MEILAKSNFREVSINQKNILGDPPFDVYSKILYYRYIINHLNLTYSVYSL